jgi:hypothetical protein
MKVIDNFLEREDFLKIQQSMLSKDFPWYFQHGINKLDTNKNINDYQFTHVFYMDNGSRSHMLDMLEPLMSKLKIGAIIKIKANLLTRTPRIIKHGFHIDYYHHTKLKDGKTAVFYLNTNNGYTLFENNKKVMSVANRMVLFNLNTPHSGTTSSDSKRRVVLNFNYI